MNVIPHLVVAALAAMQVTSGGVADPQIKTLTEAEVRALVEGNVISTIAPDGEFSQMETFWKDRKYLRNRAQSLNFNSTYTINGDLVCIKNYICRRLIYYKGNTSWLYIQNKNFTTDKVLIEPIEGFGQ